MKTSNPHSIQFGNIWDYDIIYSGPHITTQSGLKNVTYPDATHRQTITWRLALCLLIKQLLVNCKIR